MAIEDQTTKKIPSNNSMKEKHEGVCFFTYCKIVTPNDATEESMIADQSSYEANKQPSSTTIWLNFKLKKLFKWSEGLESTTDLSMGFTEVEAKMKAVIEYMTSRVAKNNNCYIKKGASSDFALIKKAIDIQVNLPPMDTFTGFRELTNRTYDDFIDLIKKLGFGSLGKRNLQRYYGYALGNKLPLSYRDLEGSTRKKTETEKRNQIIKVFIEEMAKTNC